MRVIPTYQLIVRIRSARFNPVAVSRTAAQSHALRFVLAAPLKLFHNKLVHAVHSGDNKPC